MANRKDWLGQPDLALQGFSYRRPEPAVSFGQALAAGFALAAVNVALFVWLVSI